MTTRVIGREFVLTAVAFTLAVCFSYEAFPAGLSVIPEAAFSGERGMRVHVTDTSAAFVQDNSPNSESRYRFRVWINRDNLTIQAGQEIEIFHALNDGSEDQFVVRVRNVGGVIKINVRVRLDNGMLINLPGSDEPTLGTGWRSLEFDWKASSGIAANDGYFHLWVDGTSSPGLDNLNTFSRRIDSVQLGVLAANMFTVSGSFDLDEFISRTDNFIGDSPSTIGISDITVQEDSVPSIVNLFTAFSDTETADAQLVYTIESNSNAGLFSSTSINGVAGTLTLTYAANANGEATLKVRATDTDNLFAETSFKVTVLATQPGQTSNPDPANGATDVPIDQDISWTAGSDAKSHDVYFGASNPPAFVTNTTNTTYDPGTLAEGTTYFWRIDEKNGNLTTQGSVRSFTTILPQVPEVATSPNPLDGATDVSINKDLSWTVGARTTINAVRFGTVNPPPFAADVAAPPYDPGTLQPNTTYFWKIVERNATGQAPGPVWSFTTTGAPAGAASEPDPFNGATDVAIDKNLSWTAGAGAVSHDVNFGTTNPPPFVQNQAGVTYEPGTLAFNTTYFWRIDEVGAKATTQGTVWSFTTVPQVPEKATNPNPADAATGVPLNKTFSWTVGARTATHAVRFGTVNPPPFVVQQTATTYDPGGLEPNTTYFWKIVEQNSGGQTPGDVWQFTTANSMEGDVDGDNDLDAVDVQLVINAALNLANIPAADQDGDNDVDAVDIQLVINAVLGL
jgi:hypothetical protein